MELNGQHFFLTAFTEDNIRALFQGEIESYFHRNPILTFQPTPGPEKPRGLQDAADFLGIAPATLYGICRRKEINYTKSGKKLLFFEADLKRYLDAGFKKTKKQIEAESLQQLTNPKRKTSK